MCSKRPAVLQYENILNICYTSFTHRSVRERHQTAAFWSQEMIKMSYLTGEAEKGTQSQQML